MSPESVRLDLSDGDWIEIKERLSYGDQRLLSGAFATFSTHAAIPAADASADWQRYQLMKLEIWLLDWSFRDSSDKPVPISRDAIAALVTDTAAEIEAAIDAHQAELEQLKNGKSGGSESTTT